MRNIYIITGANGFLGNNIVRQLEIDEKDEIRALVLPNSNIQSLKNLNCKIYYADVTKKDSLEDIFKVECDANVFVIHCAAIVYIKTKYAPNVYDVNVNGTKNIINKVLEINAKLIYVNSVHSIPEKASNEVITEIDNFNPNEVVGQYAKTKSETANYVLKKVKENGLNACIVHPSGIIGPNDFGHTHLTQLITDFVNKKLTACVNGGYDFVDVRDVADGIIKACFKADKGQCYILSNRYVKIIDLLNLVSKINKVAKIKTVLPMWFAKLTAPLSELYYSLLRQPPLYTRYSLYTLMSNSNFSNRKAKIELGYNNRPLEETIEDTLNWLKENNRIK